MEPQEAEETGVNSPGVCEWQQTDIWSAAVMNVADRFEETF